MDLEVEPGPRGDTEARSPLRRPPVWVCWMFVALATATPVQATDPTPKKPAAEWTDDERFEARFAPGAAAARARAQNLALRARLPEHAVESRKRLEREAKSAFAELTDFVDGNMTPELFFPFELFETLLHMCFESESKPSLENRAHTIGRWRDFGLTDDPEPMIRREAARVIAAYQKEVAVTRYLAGRRAQQLTEQEQSWSASPLAPDDTNIPKFSQEEKWVFCGGPADSLAKIRNALGEEQYSRFLRLLYVRAAPGTWITAQTDADARIAALRNQLRGCRP